jgi:hypothetical protein
MNSPGQPGDWIEARRAKTQTISGFSQQAEAVEKGDSGATNQSIGLQ